MTVYPPHTHEWIVLTFNPVIETSEVEIGGRLVPVQNTTASQYDVLLLCPHCERTKAFRSRSLSE